MNLENIIGGLVNILGERANPETIQHAHEIMNHLRTTGKAFTKEEQEFWSADFIMYRVEDAAGNAVDDAKKGEAVLYLAPREHNLIFRNIKTANAQLDSIPSNYIPDQEGIDEVVASYKKGDTLKVRLSQLRLKNSHPNVKYLEINTSDYAKSLQEGGLNTDERLLAERVYGKRQDFIKNMKMLSDSNIKITKIYVLDPDYVKKHAVNSAISRVAHLHDIARNFSFNATDATTDWSGAGRVLAERKKVA